MTYCMTNAPTVLAKQYRRERVYVISGFGPDFRGMSCVQVDAENVDRLMERYGWALRVLVASGRGSEGQLVDWARAECRAVDTSLQALGVLD